MNNTTIPAEACPPNGPIRATIHGYPRQGRDRQLKKAIERYWKRRSSPTELTEEIGLVRLHRLRTMINSGLSEIPVGDFSLYDHVLDTAVMMGAVRTAPTVHPGDSADGTDLDHYFSLARGADGVAPLEMTKWFDSNYHYLVPELSAATRFRLDPTALLEQLEQAREVGAPVRVVVLGPVSFLALCTSVDPDPDFTPLQLLDRLLDPYTELLSTLAEHDVGWVQFDEPISVTDPISGSSTPSAWPELDEAYQRLSAVSGRPKILVASQYGALGPASDTVANLPVEGVAIDFSPRARENLQLLAEHPGLRTKRVVAGLVDARNVWRTDLDTALATARTVADWCDQLDIASSASLFHLPHDLEREVGLDPRLVAQLAFADEKIGEIVTLAKGLAEGDEAIAAELAVDRARRSACDTDDWLRIDQVRQRSRTVTGEDLRRPTPYQRRSLAQQEKLRLPDLPTTTIGSFPQTPEVRTARADLRSGRIDDAAYRTAMESEIDRVIALQEDIGLDVLVHGEPERNDMVQYFADQLTGVFGTEHGWVQSYGTRCVRPPVIAGDVTRAGPMTVEWSRYAQSRTARPVKAMLTGPVTLLAWSFVRDDQPRAETARQLALALRDEVTDLEAAGIDVVQVDEPGLRELLPLRRNDREEYLRWAVDAFRLATAGVAETTQVHTHMCYADFGDILAAIDEMDADVISLEAARSRMQVVAELAEFGYRRQVGPGVWDIHSPQIPAVEEVADLARLAVDRIGADRVWLNPDCGLKTRSYREVIPALRAIVAAAHTLR